MYHHFTQVKVNDYCQFPLELNMRPYTKEGLLDHQRGTRASGKEEQGFVGATTAYPDAYYEYKLAGVLVHTGTADSGHYYSYIKRRNIQVYIILLPLLIVRPRQTISRCLYCVLCGFLIAFDLGLLGDPRPTSDPQA